MKKKLLKILKVVSLLLLFLIGIRLFSPTWTPSIEGANSISELTKVAINGTGLEVMIRGNDKNNPVLIFVHGGPCCSEIPYVRKYQKNLEKDFTIVHYDQRGSGKSYTFGEDASTINATAHTDDLIALTEYIKEYLGKEQVILIGHSYGTYIATIAASQRPDLYQAYIGIGQMSNTIESESNSLAKCIKAAENSGNKKDAQYLKSLEAPIAKGERIAPRNYLRKYGFAARKINDTADYWKGFFFGTEYNLLDAIRFYTASVKYQDSLIAEALNNPITDIVTELHLPVYFVMGKYDGMTSPETAERYLHSITGEGTKEFILFDESAHYPQFEEEEKFYQWMKNTFTD
ncbi:MAG: alpha/beta fold hydrolase [Lachnospiraceae bacterium]